MNKKKIAFEGIETRTNIMIYTRIKAESFCRNSIGDQLKQIEEVILYD